MLLPLKVKQKDRGPSPVFLTHLSRFVIESRLIIIVDALCSSAVVVDGNTPSTPIRIRNELNAMIVL